MRKLIIAASLMAAFGAAQAQSNVTIYGVADASFEFVDANGGTNNAAGTAVTNSANRNRVATNSSYIGFKGSEDLGNGLRAEFQIENELEMTGAYGNSRSNGFANRDTFVGLSSKDFGTVRMGYLSTPHRVVATSFDLLPGGGAGSGSSLNLIGRANVGALLNPRGFNGVSGATEQQFGSTTGAATNLIGAGNGTLDNTAAYIGRSQAIAYVSPTWNGLTGVLAYTNNENRDNAALGAGLTTRNPYAWNAAVLYKQGGLDLAYSYLDSKDAGVLNGTSASGLTAAGLNALGLTGEEHHRAHLFGASYNFGQGTTVAGVVDYFDGSLGGQAAGDISVKRTAFTMGVKHVIGQHSLTAAYTHAGDTKYGVGSRAVTGSTTENGADQYTLRYGYDFSKRTQLYAQYVRLNNDANASYDLTGGNNVTGTGNGAVNAGANVSSLGVGLRHAF